MTHPATSFSIIAATLYGNRGAQAMLETVVGRLSREFPGARFEVFSYYPGDDRRLLDDPRVRLHSSTPAALVGWLLPMALVFGILLALFGRRALRIAPLPIRALGRSRALIDLAGVAFIDGREKFLPFNVLTLLPAWMLRVPVTKMPQAMGPFNKALNRLTARIALPCCRMIWARGARTLAHLQLAGFPGMRFDQCDDIAFNHESRYSLTDESAQEVAELLRLIETARGAPGVNSVIGVCPSSVVSTRSRAEGGNYEAALGDLVARLSRSHVVVLFPNATRDTAGDVERNNDLPLIRRVLAAALEQGDSGRILAFTGDINAAGIKRIIGALDVAVVSRFHAMIGALASGVPVAVLGWSHKYAEVMARFGLERDVMDYKQLDAQGLLRRVEHVIEDRQVTRRAIASALPAVKASADRPFVSLAAGVRRQ
jgi:polysaccharide pyruvyl transferase WcaK-like protein